MKLTHPDLECQIALTSLNITEWVVESPVLFSRYVQELYQQVNGEEGGFVFSDGDQELELSKWAELIADPLALDFNDRKIQKKLYAELLELSKGEVLYSLTQELRGSILNYLLQLEYESGYELNINAEVDIASLFKAADVAIECDTSDFFGRLARYVRVMAELLRKKLIILVNVRGYLDELQTAQLAELAMYHEVTLLFVESVQRDLPCRGRCYIMDRDGCEIC